MVKYAVRDMTEKIKGWQSVQQELKTYALCISAKSMFVHMSRVMKKPTLWFPTRSDTKRAVHPLAEDD